VAEIDNAELLTYRQFISLSAACEKWTRLQGLTEAREGMGVKVFHVLAILLATLVTTFLLSTQTHLYGSEIVNVVK
jgi:hypothetical protein